MEEKRIIDESTLPVACLTILSQTIGMSFIELGNSVPKKKLAFWKVSRHLAKSALDPVHSDSKLKIPFGNCYGEASSFSSESISIIHF